MTTQVLNEGRVTSGRNGWAFWSDEEGLILSAELIIIVTLVVIGLITGLVCVQQAVVSELQDVAAAMHGMDQSYWTPTFRGCRKFFGFTSWKSGSGFIDSRHAGFVDGGAGFSELGSGRGRSQIIENAPQVAPSLQQECLTCPPAETAPRVVMPPVQPDCLECGPTLHPGHLHPIPEQIPPLRAPEIPQGPVPQILPQSN